MSSTDRYVVVLEIGVTGSEASAPSEWDWNMALDWDDVTLLACRQVEREEVNDENGAQVLGETADTHRHPR